MESVDQVRTESTKKSAFRFINVHLEAFRHSEILEAQVREFFASGSPEASASAVAAR